MLRQEYKTIKKINKQDIAKCVTNLVQYNFYALLKAMQYFTRVTRFTKYSISHPYDTVAEVVV